MNTNSRTFRTKLSEFFDKAIKKPISIARGSDRFVLMNEEEYLALKEEVLSLQRNLLAMLDVRTANAKSSTDASDLLSQKLDSAFQKVKKQHRPKKVVGE
jgi:PHD/YefM family antitoxin component YafN of YafNO toxin-antitoxin module